MMNKTNSQYLFDSFPLIKAKINCPNYYWTTTWLWEAKSQQRNSQ